MCVCVGRGEGGVGAEGGIVLNSLPLRFWERFRKTLRF